jgi:hypothetical protein
MPKQVTEEDLASGLRALGGMGALGKTRRDSPFRDSRVEEKTVELPPAKPVKQAESVRAEVVAAEIEPEPRPTPARGTAPLPKVPRAEKKKPAQRKADIYSERVTLQISPEMRDEVDELARTLQRAKATKAERITANSVMRVAIQLLVNGFDLGAGEAPNNEAELLELVTSKCRWQ